MAAGAAVTKDVSQPACWRFGDLYDHEQRSSQGVPSVADPSLTSQTALGIHRAPVGALAFQVSLVPLLALVAATVGFPAIPQTLAGRLELMRNSLDLALDHPFSGVGLGGFQAAYSTYVMLLHVGYIVHSHNLYLNVWLEQGLLGLAVLAWLVVIAGQTVARYILHGPAHPRRALPVAALCLPAASALLVILFHGLADDAFYGSRAVLLLFVPFGVLAAVRLEGSAPDAERHRSRWLPLAVAGLIALALLPGVRAAFQANLGALAQTHAELALYRWPEWPIQDQLRRAPQVDLQPAPVHYQAALAIDPHNATANRRLGQIALSLGQTGPARAYLEAAFAAAPDQRATRQLLGESYAVAGDLSRAAALWRTVDTSAGQLELREW